MKLTHRMATMAVTLLVLAVLVSCGKDEVEPGAADDTAPPRDKGEIVGAGATFPGPLYRKWIEEYQDNHPEVNITYDAVGSGEGIERFLNEAVDFGASDAAMSDGQIAQVQRSVRLVPVTAGMVVLAYNPVGLGETLKLKRDVYVDIFAGEIRHWHDPRIKPSNPDIELPHQSITLVARRDSSGTTYAFTNHLGAVSEAWWDQGPGVGKLIDWPGNTMTAMGNEGVAQRIKISWGAIGYVEYGFAKRLGLPMAWLENKEGQFIQPDAQSGQQALAGSAAQMPDDLRLFIPDPDGENAYPIITYSWLLLYRRYADGDKAATLKDFVNWGLTDGQVCSDDLGYVPLPPNVVPLAQSAVNEIQ